MSSPHGWGLASSPDFELCGQDAFARVEEAGIRVSSKRVGEYQLKELLDESDHFQEWLEYIQN